MTDILNFLHFVKFPCMPNGCPYLVSENVLDEDTCYLSQSCFGPTETSQNQNKTAVAGGVNKKNVTVIPLDYVCSFYFTP